MVYSHFYRPLRSKREIYAVVFYLFVCHNRHECQSFLPEAGFSRFSEGLLRNDWSVWTKLNLSDGSSDRQWADDHVHCSTTVDKFEIAIDKQTDWHVNGQSIGYTIIRRTVHRTVLPNDCHVSYKSASTSVTNVPYTSYKSARKCPTRRFCNCSRLPKCQTPCYKCSLMFTVVLAKRSPHRWNLSLSLSPVTIQRNCTDGQRG